MPIELLIIDDGSSDDSYEVIKRYLDSDHTPASQVRVDLRTQSNQGMCNTLNAIAKQAQGKYISFLGSDDFWFPEKLREQVAFLESHPEFTLVHSNSVKVDAGGKTIKKIDYSRRQNTGNLFKALITRTGGINTPSHLYRRSVYDDIGYYDPTYSFEDTDFWLRLTKNHSVGFIDAVHTGYRWHGNNLSQSANALKFYNEELISIFRKNIHDPQLLKIALRIMYKKSIVKALKIFDLKKALDYSKRYLQLYKEHSG